MRKKKTLFGVSEYARKSSEPILLLLIKSSFVFLSWEKWREINK